MIVLILYLFSLVITLPVCFAASNAYWKYEFLGLYDGSRRERIGDFIASIFFGIVFGLLSLAGLGLMYILTQGVKHGLRFKVDFVPNRFDSSVKIRF